ncbi:MAG TPA: insulinase family protein [Ruminococcus sp.]|nr:insulinase family protein [Ruminococcus sp.]
MNVSEIAGKFGFTLTRERSSKELGGTLLELRHNETGAPLCWLDNGASNKLFAVAFRTIPEDHTGVFHILEHSVLCGSDKFPLKEPFVDLLKSSMQTFLNAMTYPDKTVYPVSSRDPQDFLNLTKVYLDAVFAPLIRFDPKCFLQEGWHLEFAEDGTPSYKGVVFNETKGAFTDVDEIIDDALRELLFPDNSGKFCSGGRPENIPDLTYEHYLDTWKRFYHPSNCCFYLDGSVPLEETLELISGYLSGKGKLADLPVDPLQEPVSGERVISYEIGADESAEKRTLFTMSKILGNWSEIVTDMAAEVLSEYLAGSNEAPLKKAILDAGLGQDVDCGSMDGVSQSYFILTVRNLDQEQIPALRELISSTVNGLADKGLDKDELEACINRMEFRMKNMGEPQGLTRCIKALDGQFYTGDPMADLEFGQCIAQIREMAKGSGFEELLRRIFSPEGMCCVTAVPDKEEGRRREEAEAASLAKRVAEMTPEQRSAAEKAAKELAAWQAVPDSEEARATIPVLSPEEISPDPEPVPTQADEAEEITVLRHIVPTRGILHFSLYFDVSQLSLEQLSQLSTISELLGQLPTKRHTAAQLQQLIRRYIGALDFGLTSAAELSDRESCKPLIVVRCSALEEKAQQAADLICEILTETDFTCTEQIRTILLQTEETNRQTVIAEGHRIGMRATLAQYSTKNAAWEAMGGFSFVEAVHQLVKEGTAGCEKLAELIGSTLSQSVCKKRLTLSITSDTQPDILSMLTLPEGEAGKGSAKYKTALPERLGIAIPASVSYAAQGWHTSRRTGALLVVAKILSLDYLWNTVRVQGGAYGSGLAVEPSGNFACYSYRDPSPARSLGAYAKIADVIEEWCAGSEDLTRYMISTVSDTEPLRSPGKLGIFEDDAWMCGIDLAHRQQLRKEILSVTREDLLELCGVLRELGQKGSICVAGSADAVGGCDGLEIKSL